jgi:hypothetical protein
MLALAVGALLGNGTVVVAQGEPEAASAPAVAPAAAGASEDVGSGQDGQGKEAPPPDEKPAAQPEGAPAAAAPAGSSESSLPQMAPLHMHAHALSNEDRWETGFDAKLTTLFTRDATDIASPTVMLGAQWNYRFPTDTFIGLSAAGMPTNNEDTGSNNTQRSFSIYYAGLNLAQGLVSFDSWRASVTVSAGRGIVYVRSLPPNAAPTIGNTPFNYVEPGFYITFLQYSSLDIGAVVSYRMAMLANKDFATNSDLSSMAVGLTFRNLSR